MVTGAWPSVSVMRAPICCSGLRMRSMGRRVSEASPISVKRAVLRREQAGDHAHGRAGVAAIERLARGSDAAANAVTSMQPSSCRVTVAPRACMQASVDAQSAPVEKLVKREVPSANAPSMA